MKILLERLYGESAK